MKIIKNLVLVALVIATISIFPATLASAYSSSIREDLAQSINDNIIVLVVLIATGVVIARALYVEKQREKNRFSSTSIFDNVTDCDSLNFTMQMQQQMNDQFMQQMNQQMFDQFMQDMHDHSFNDFGQF